MTFAIAIRLFYEHHPEIFKENIMFITTHAHALKDKSGNNIRYSMVGEHTAQIPYESSKIKSVRVIMETKEGKIRGYRTTFKDIKDIDIWLEETLKLTSAIRNEKIHEIIYK